MRHLLTWTIQPGVVPRAFQVIFNSIAVVNEFVKGKESGEIDEDETFAEYFESEYGDADDVQPLDPVR